MHYATALRTLVPFLFVFLLTHRSDASDHRAFTLRIGEQKVVPFENGERYAPSGNAVRVTRFTSDGRESLLIKAERAGRSSLLVWRAGAEPETISVQVLATSAALPSAAEGRTQFLNSLEDARVTPSPGRDSFTLQGEVRTLSEGRRIRAYASANPDQTTDRTYPSAEVFRGCLRNLRNELDARRLSELKLEFSEGERWIEVNGYVKSDARIEGVRAPLADACPWARLQIDADAGRVDLIRLKVVLIENYSSDETLLGMNTAFAGPSQLSVRSGKWLSQFGVVSSLRALESRGKLRILSQPEIVLRTPGEAELFSGGELPIETTTKYQSQVFWKNFGLALKVKSLSVTTRKVRLDLSAEVSQIDQSLSSERHPGLQSNRLKTEVEAHFSEPLLLSGLYKTAIGSSETGVPFLGRLPFFNLLFSDTQNSHRRTELLAILIPYRDVPKLSREKVYGLARSR